MKVIITDCDHDSIDIEKKVFADAGNRQSQRMR